MKRRLAVSVAALALVALSALHTVDDLGREYTDRAMTAAVVTFGVARVMNGVISVIQGTNVSISPAGVGINLTVGEILDPVNDLLEQFSWVMLAAITSIGIQQILLAIGASLGFNLTLALAVAYLLLALWLPARNWLRTDWGLKATLLVLALRFAIALVVLANHGVYVAFMEQQASGSTAALERTSEQLDRLGLSVPGARAPGAGAPSSSAAPGSQSRAESAVGDPVAERARPQDDPMGPLAGVGTETAGMAPQGRGENWLGGVRRFFEGAADMVNPAPRIEAMEQAASAAIDHMFRLIAIFVLQTILIPLGFLWGMYRLVRWLLTARAPARLIAPPHPEREPGPGRDPPAP